MYSKQRIEILSDGIFAIVMTLLVLDVKVPVDVPSGHLWQALQMEGHLWASYLVTFVLAAYYWTIQHRLLNLIERMEPRTVSTTFIFLLLVTILPFSTALWGHYLTDPLAFFLYTLNHTLIAIVVVAELQLARRAKTIRLGTDLWILSGKLYVMVGSLLAALVIACFLPLRYVVIGGLTVAIAARWLRHLCYKRYLKRSSASPMRPAQPS
jgi:uncharacterized membrane protein